MDADMAESVAGVVRLLRRAAELVWLEADAEGPRSDLQLLALSVDVAADEARALLPSWVNVDAGPVPVGVVPVELLRSAERLTGHMCRSEVPAGLVAVRARLVELVWEANTGAGA
jgi:pilus assembly protein TadC